MAGTGVSSRDDEFGHQNGLSILMWGKNFYIARDPLKSICQVPSTSWIRNIRMFPKKICFTWAPEGAVISICNGRTRQGGQIPTG